MTVSGFGPVHGPAPAADWPRHHAGRDPGGLAMVDHASGRRLDWRTLDARIDGLAAGLAARHGAGWGDRVAVLARNSTDVFEIQFACWRLGAIFVPLNWRLTAAELTGLSADCTPRVLIHGPGFAEAARAATEGQGTALLALDPGRPCAYEALAAGSARPERLARPTHEDVAAILYTSGTTGQPKGVLITHGMVFWNAANLGLPSEIDRRSVHLTVLPLFHTAGLNAYGNVVAMAGGTNVVLPGFDAAEVLAALGDPDLGVTHTYLVPSGYQFLAEDPYFATADLGRLRIAGTGGSPCARALLETWAARGVALQQGYGMTETSPTVMLLDTARVADKLGSAGVPALHTEVRLVGEDGAEIVGAGVTGELQVRGTNVTPGYWNAPEATAAAFREGGWFATGDAATRDADGFYTIVDRWKDMFISGGENVSPAEVEDALLRHPAVAEAAVVGVPHARWGEVGQAVLVLRRGETASPDDIRAHCRTCLAGFKVPAHIRFVDDLPRTGSGKVRKHVLRSEFDA